MAATMESMSHDVEGPGCVYSNSRLMLAQSMLNPKYSCCIIVRHLMPHDGAKQT